MEATVKGGSPSPIGWVRRRVRQVLTTGNLLADQMPERSVQLRPGAPPPLLTFLEEPHVPLWIRGTRAEDGYTDGYGDGWNRFSDRRAHPCSLAKVFALQAAGRRRSLSSGNARRREAMAAAIHRRRPGIHAEPGQQAVGFGAKLADHTERLVESDQHA